MEKPTKMWDVMRLPQGIVTLFIILRTSLEKKLGKQLRLVAGWIKNIRRKRLAVCKRLETGSVSKRFLRFSISENNDPWQGYTGVGQDLNLVVKSDRWKDLNIPVYTHSLFPTQL